MKVLEVSNKKTKPIMFSPNSDTSKKRQRHKKKPTQNTVVLQIVSVLIHHRSQTGSLHTLLTSTCTYTDFLMAAYQFVSGINYGPQIWDLRIHTNPGSRSVERSTDVYFTKMRCCYLRSILQWQHWEKKCRLALYTSLPNVTLKPMGCTASETSMLQILHQMTVIFTSTTAPNRYAV